MATSYTSNKKISGLDPVVGSLSASDSIVIEKGGDTLRASIEQVESRVFSSKPTGTAPQTGDTVVIRRGSQIRQLETQNLIPDGAITNTQISALAAIDHTKLANITAGQVLMGSAGNIPTATTLTGDVTVNSSGVTAISSGVIVNADVKSDAAIAGTKITPNFGSQDIVTTGTSVVNNISFINGAAASFRIIQLQTSQVARWNIGATNIAESGSNAGSNLFIDRFADNGDFLERCFHINRATGNVSIGNSSPQGRLHIESDSDTTLVITDTNTSTFSLGTGNASVLGTDSSGGFVFKTGVTTGSLFSTGTERLRIAASGNVGIGDASPTRPLQITNNGGCSMGLTDTSTGGATLSLTPPNNSNGFAQIDASGANAIRFTNNSAERLRIDSSGNVGIGTDSPSTVGGKFCVVGSSSVLSAVIQNTATGDLTFGGSYTQYEFKSQSATAALIQVGGSGFLYGGAGSFNVWNSSNAPVTIGTNATERVRVTAGGNVGIGKTNPSTILDVSGTVTATAFSGPLTGNVTGNVTGDVSGNAGTVTNGVYTNTDQTISGKKVFNSENNTIASAPGGTNKLEVVGTGAAAMLSFHRPGAYAVHFGLDSDNQLKVGGWSLSGSSYLILHSNNYNSYAPTLTGGNASGTWGISITGNANYANSAGSAGSATVAGYVSGNSNNFLGTTTELGGGGVTVQRANSNGAATMTWNRSVDAGAGSSTVLQFRHGGSTVVGSVSHTNTATTYATSSDYRLKEDVAALENGLDVVAAITPVEFKWKQDGSTGRGFIAHELQAVVPEAVVGAKDAANEYQGVDAAKVVPYLVSAIKTLKSRIEQLEAA